MTFEGHPQRVRPLDLRHFGPVATRRNLSRLALDSCLSSPLLIQSSVQSLSFITLIQQIHVYYDRLHLSFSSAKTASLSGNYTYIRCFTRPSPPSASQQQRQQLHNRMDRDARRFTSQRFLSRHGTCAAKVFSRWPMTPGVPASGLGCCIKKETERGREREVKRRGVRINV